MARMSRSTTVDFISEVSGLSGPTESGVPSSKSRRLKFTEAEVKNYLLFGLTLENSLKNGQSLGVWFSESIPDKSTCNERTKYRHF